MRQKDIWEEGGTITMEEYLRKRQAISRKGKKEMEARENAGDHPAAALILAELLFV